jgi:hypothetical protein
MKGLTICPICERFVILEKDNAICLRNIWYHGPCSRFARAQRVMMTGQAPSDAQKIEAVSQKLGGPITDVYAAYWFLKDHSQFIRYERTPVTLEEHTNFKIRSKGNKLIKDDGGNYWEEWRRGEIHAIDENLVIFYTHVDETGHVNGDVSKNLNTECWLEFGHVYWGYSVSWEADDGERCYPIYCHDPELDCGGPSFDEALIELANIVLKRFGPIPKQQD